MVKGDRLFIDINTESTCSMGGKKHWLLAVKDSTDHAFFQTRNVS